MRTVQMRVVVSAATLVGLGCAFEAEGLGSGNVDLTTGDHAQGSGATDPGSSGPPIETSGNGSASGTSNGTITSGAGVTTEATTQDDATDDSGAPPPASCADVLLANPAAVSGAYDIEPPSATLDLPIEVFCDMETAGGGWTLVGRSVPGGFDEGEFGWTGQRGEATDLSMPYSLDVAEAAIPFTQILAGRRGDGLDWGDPVFAVNVSFDVLALVDSALRVDSIQTITGSCDPGDGPTMLRYVGYSAETRFFFFRESDSHNEFGLWHDGWETYYDTVFQCSGGADLDGDQGMLMIR